MNYKEDLIEECKYVICPLCTPEYVHCDEKCEQCEINKEFEKWCKENCEVE